MSGSPSSSLIARFVFDAGLREIEAEPDPDVAIGHAVLQRLLQRRDRLLRLPGLVIHVGELDVGVHGVDAPRDDAAEERDRLADAALLKVFRRDVEISIDVDEALRVVRLGIGRCAAARCR